VGHGGASFVWRNALPAIKQGLLADSISTDLHTSSMLGGMKDMNNVMSKFLAMDVPFAEVIKMSTWTPAQMIKRADLGHLSEGAGADLAVINLRQGQFGFIDVRNARRMGKQKIETEMTFRDGRVVWDLNGRAGYRYNDPQ
jgi:dihydroorotase